MVPGLTEREFQALEAIRREWLDSDLTRRVPQPLDTSTPIRNRVLTAFARLTGLCGQLIARSRASGMRGTRSSAKPAAARGHRPEAGESWGA